MNSEIISDETLENLASINTTDSDSLLRETLKSKRILSSVHCSWLDAGGASSGRAEVKVKSSSISDDPLDGVGCRPDEAEEDPMTSIRDEDCCGAFAVLFAEDENCLKGSF